MKRRSQTHLPHHNKKTDEERFWDKVSRKGKKECWLWQGATTGSRRGWGHGRFYYEGQLMMAAHFLWKEILHRTIPSGLQVLHSCDVPQCVNPAHLSLGTQSENAKQMYERGRGPNNKGENHGRSKLTEANVKEIRRRKAGGEAGRELADMYGVSDALIWYITSGTGWQHVS